MPFSAFASAACAPLGRAALSVSARFRFARDGEAGAGAGGSDGGVSVPLVAMAMMDAVRDAGLYAVWRSNKQRAQAWSSGG